MPEETADYFRLPNPNYSGEAFADTGTRTVDLSSEQGVKALYAPLKRTGNFKVRTFLFAKSQWASAEACQTWVREHRESFKAADSDPATVWTGETQFVPRGNDSAPTPDELEIINQYALKPLAAEDVYVREMRLTNDQWSRNHTVRMSRGFQKSIMADFPGKSLLLGHPETKEMAAIPEGRFFDAAEEYDPSTGTTWGRTKFYVVKTAQNEHLRAQIDGGVYQHTSVGMLLDERQCSLCGNDVFSRDCIHIPGQAYQASEVVNAELKPEPHPTEPGKVFAGIIFRGQGRALEGSIVYLPELRGTQVVAEAHLAARAGDFAGAKRLLLSEGGLPADAGDPNDALGATGDHADPDPSGDAGELSANTDGGESTMTEAEVQTLEAEKVAAETKATTLEAQVADLTAKVQELEATKATLETQVGADAPIRASVVADIARLAGLAKRTTELEAFKAAFGAELEAMPADKLVALQTDWTKLVDELLPGGRTSTATDPNGGDNAETCAVDLSHWG